MPVLSTTPLDASPARKTETKTSRQTEGAVALPRKRRAKAARGEEIVVKTGLVVEVPVGGVGVVFFFSFSWGSESYASGKMTPTSDGQTRRGSTGPSDVGVIFPERRTRTHKPTARPSRLASSLCDLCSCTLLLLYYYYYYLAARLCLLSADCRYTTMYFYFCVSLCLQNGQRTLSIYRGGKPASRVREWLAGTVCGRHFSSQLQVCSARSMRSCRVASDVQP
jgi:hypothetical protein